MSGATLWELIEDLQVERRKLATLVGSLEVLRNQWQGEGSTDERVDAAALRLQSLYTGIERCLTQSVRVLNGSAPEGADASSSGLAAIRPSLKTCKGEMARPRRFITIRILAANPHRA